MSIRHNSRLVAIVDDESVQSASQDLIESDGLSTLCFDSAEQFLKSKARHTALCLIADIRMPGMAGLELQAKLKAGKRVLQRYRKHQCALLLGCSASEVRETRTQAIEELAKSYPTQLQAA